MFWRIVLCMLDSRHKRVLFIIHVLVSMHIILIQRLFNTGHVAIHFKLVFDIDLLVEHLFVGYLVVFFIPFMLIVENFVLISLGSGLLFIEFKSVIHLFKQTFFIYLHFDLFHVHFIGIEHLVINLLLLIVITLAHFFLAVVLQVQTILHFIKALSSY